MRLRFTTGSSAAHTTGARAEPAAPRAAGASGAASRRGSAARVLVVALLATSVFFSPAARADPATAGWSYLRTYLDWREKLGVATGQAEGIVEVRGVIQGKMSSQQTTTWMVRSGEEDDAPSYQIVSPTDLPAFVVGTRVCALGRGLAVSGASLELIAMVLETEMAAWERANTPKQPAPRPEPTRIITYRPAGQTVTPSAPPAEAASPVQSPAPARSSTAPNAPPPPRWRGPSGKAQPGAADPKQAPPKRAAATEASRAWAGYLAAYTRAIRYFNPRLSSTQADGIARSILAFSSHYRIDPRLVVAVIAVESGFSPTATSHKGAMGLGQLMPGTAAGLGVRDAYDPVENIYGAVKLLRGHLKAHSGKPFWEQLALALASYNAGSGAVKRYGGVPPYKETQRYVVKVARLYAHLCGYKPKK